MGQESAVLIGLSSYRQKDKIVNEYMDELEFLALTAGVVSKKRFIQKLDPPHSSTFVGKGKINEIKDYIKEHCIDIAIFDDDLTPTQIRNIESILECKILDRSNLILDIFATRARTSTAKAQVELAQYQYLLPRLTRMWTHLERQKGGIGMRGPGETQIETDRRIIGQKISKLKEKLKKIDKQKSEQRNNRGSMVRVALVGYTNSGKSSLMTLLSKSDVFAENKLFATLDTTVRKVVLNNIPFLLSDTVGFIRKLPHQLIESFKSTLDEIREADILIHLVDISATTFEEQIAIVNETLLDINKDLKPVILVFNKIDKLKLDDEELEKLNMTWMSKLNKKSIFISVIKKTNIEELKKLMSKSISEIHHKRFPYGHTYNKY